jgi:hypothetical protein
MLMNETDDGERRQHLYLSISHLTSPALGAGPQIHVPGPGMAVSFEYPSVGSKRAPGHLRPASCEGLANHLANAQLNRPVAHRPMQE